MCGAGAAAVFLLACRALELRCRQLRYLVNTEACTTNGGIWMDMGDGGRQYYSVLMYTNVTMSML